MILNNNQQAFITLIKAGLWGQEAHFLSHGVIDYSEVLKFAEEQAVVGLVTEGLEHVCDVQVPKEDLLQFIGQSLQIEQQNKELNEYLAKLIELLRNKDIYSILVKGQGIAQCYEKPLWRASGDIDLLLSDINYEKAKHVLLPLAVDVEDEYKTMKHIGMTMQGDIVVELHGTLHSRLSNRVDRVIDEAQKDIFCGGNVRPWMNENTPVFLPSPDDDVIFVFTHILHHYYIEGIGLRQICDWCRLLYTYKDFLNHGLLKSRIRRAGLMTEWKAFAAFAVEYLGIPIDAMPLFDENDNQNKKLKRKAERILEFVLECGNFGHSRQVSHGKVNSALNKMKDFIRQMRVFPIDSIKFFCHFMIDGIQLTIVKESVRK